MIEQGNLFEKKPVRKKNIKKDKVKFLVKKYCN